VTDHDPAALSGALLARKGTAGAGGFAPMALDPNERRAHRFGWLGAWSNRSLHRGLSSSAVVAIAIVVGATASWVSAPSRQPAPDPVAVAGPSVPGDASWTQIEPEPEASAWRSDHLLAAAGDANGHLDATTTTELPPNEPPVMASLAPEPPVAVSGKPIAVEPLTSTVPSEKVPAAATNGRPPVKSNADPAALVYRVQLHTLGSRTAVDREWVRLRRQHADLLADKQLVVDRLDRSNGAAKYRLQLGNLPNRSAAQQLCRAFAQRGQKCFVVPTS
jgi:hypothetical protein